MNTVIEQIEQRIAALKKERTEDTAKRGHKNQVARIDRACMSAEIRGLETALELIRAAK